MRDETYETRPRSSSRRTCKGAAHCQDPKQNLQGNLSFNEQLNANMSCRLEGLRLMLVKLIPQGNSQCM